jgi:hypothetical protein
VVVVLFGMVWRLYFVKDCVPVVLTVNKQTNYLYVRVQDLKMCARKGRQHQKEVVESCQTVCVYRMYTL